MLRNKDRPPPSPSYMSEDQMGQQSRYLPTTPSRPRECSTIQEEDSHQACTASYLKDLRTNKSRPSGSRPPPPSKFGSLRRAETETAKDAITRETHAQTQNARPTLQPSSSMPILPPQGTTHRRANSSLGFNGPFAGRPLARPPSATPPETEANNLNVRPVLRRPTSAVYMEQGTRWMEKQEAKSLRLALEDMDVAGEEKVHKAAQDEAAELVWKHQNPASPFNNPDATFENPDAKRDYRSHLRKGSYTRSHSKDSVPQVASRSSSGGSERPSTDTSASSARPSLDSTRKVASTPAVSSLKSQGSKSKGYGDLAAAVKKDIDTARRRVSSGSKRVMSAEKKIFMHPNDRIYEDPQEEATPPKKQSPSPRPIPDLRPGPSPVQPSLIRKNPFARVRMQQEKLERTQSAPILPRVPMLPQPAPRLDRVEIQRNPPTQSRNALYMSNDPLSPTLPRRVESVPEEDVSPKGTPTKDGKEIRGDDIRAATSKQRKDRSPNLPQPTMVSDKPGRPIVSFKKEWKPREVVLEEVHSPPASRSSPEISRASATQSPRSSPFSREHIPRIEPPRISVNQPPIPTINFPDEQPAPPPPIPTINLPDDETIVASIPTIVLPEEPDFASSSSQSLPPTPAINVQAAALSIIGPGYATRSSVNRSTTSRPLPAVTPAHRPLPTPTQRGGAQHALTSPLPKSTPHYTPSIRQSGVLCAHCALPIAGRILSAANQRFHPSCFKCHECATNLELVAFYPEPDSARSLRLDRIAARQAGLPLPNPEDDTPEQEAADGDTTQRFYCHLDFHEHFSPRCKSCKTPIEGEVIVACGAHWHAGHFFCAQCGDPFDSSTPFVEKDGYAWCVGCHTNRYSAKCRKCRKPVTDVVVKALGSEWHGECFVCLECNGEFEDGKYFLRGESQDPVCVRCEERRLKA